MRSKLIGWLGWPARLGGQLAWVASSLGNYVKLSVAAGPVYTSKVAGLKPVNIDGFFVDLKSLHYRKFEPGFYQWFFNLPPIVFLL